MAFASAALSGVLSKKWSLGPVKVEIQSISAVSGDTAGTVTAKALSTVLACIPISSSLKLTALPTLSGATASLAFTDPAANAFGYVILLGV